ncbi:Gibberellin-regulated family protein [Euphorbia peplus]|nr:Gibberellin-regulated family protein [Euphorbia peplus]
MAYKPMSIMVAALLLVSLVAANEEEVNNKGIYSKIVAPTPTPAPAPKVVVKPTPPVVKPGPTPPVVKPTPPMVKPGPTPVPVPAPAPPVVIKPPTASPPSSAPLPPVRSIKDCEPLCAERCKKHSRKNVCERACMTCCDRCRCVPPGTYGNRERCGTCYTSMTTRGNKPKCP